MSRMYLSIITPLYNEEEGVLFLAKELTSVCQGLNKNYEIILVDDGSRDGTFHILEEAARNDNHLKIIKLSRNFGHQAAFAAGIDMAQGDFVITMDGDLQHPPKMIPVLLEKAETENLDIVIGERLANKQNSRIREFAGRLFYDAMTLATDLEFKNVSDFALYKKSVISALKQLPEKERYLRGLVQWVGFRKAYVSYAVDERKFGVPKYTAKKLFRLVMNGITSFSGLPLRLAFWLGLVIMIGSLGLTMYVVLEHYFRPNPNIAGWSTLVILVLFMGSVQLIVMGVIGEYLYRMFNEIKSRPTYIVAETRNVEKENLAATNYGIFPR